jgi:hypothetical protein
MDGGSEAAEEAQMSKNFPGKHSWHHIDPPPRNERYVEHSWGYATCLKCRALRFYHEHGPKGGIRVVYTWPRGHVPAMPGTPKRYQTASIGDVVPPCVHLLPKGVA